MTNQKITTKDALNIIGNNSLIWTNDSAINAYTNGTNFYNSGVYGWNYSIAYNSRHDCYVVAGYRIPKAILDKVTAKMSYEEAKENNT